MGTEAITTAEIRLLEAPYFDEEGNRIGTLALDSKYFGSKISIPLMHQVVLAHERNRRRGTQNTRTRSEVRGGGAKPFRQKGTGRARQGSIRAPHYVGGGVALGPKPRSYEAKTPKKMVRLALLSALSQRVKEKRIGVIKQYALENPSTKKADSILSNMGLYGRILIVHGETEADRATRLSFRNLEGVSPIAISQLNTYEILRHDWIIFDEANLFGEYKTLEIIDPPKTKDQAAKGKADGVSENPEKTIESDATETSEVDE